MMMNEWQTVGAVFYPFLNSLLLLFPTSDRSEDNGTETCNWRSGGISYPPTDVCVQTSNFVFTVVDQKGNDDFRLLPSLWQRI